MRQPKGLAVAPGPGEFVPDVRKVRIRRRAGDHGTSCLRCVQKVAPCASGGRQGRRCLAARRSGLPGVLVHGDFGELEAGVAAAGEVDGPEAGEDQQLPVPVVLQELCIGAQV